MKNRTFLVLLPFLLFAGACTSSGNSNEQALKELIVKANDEMFNQGNLDYADQVFTSDYAGDGPNLIKTFVSEMRIAFPDLNVTIEPLIAEGNMTAWRRTHTGTHQGVYMGFAPSGKKISWEDIVISRYEYGKVAEEWAAGNLLEILQESRKH